MGTSYVRQWVNCTRGVPEIFYNNGMDRRANPHYSCLVNLKGINRRKRSKEPVAHSGEMSSFPFSHLLELSEEDESAMNKENICRENDSDFEAVSLLAEGFIHHEFDDVIKVLRFFVPFVYLSSGGLFSPFTDMANNVDFPSVFSSKVLGASFPLSFKERLLNTFYNGFFWGVFKFYLMPRTEKICKERGLCSENLSLFDLGNNSSLTIINSFKTLEVPPRPVIPNIIYAGGAHIKPAKGVPKDLESWIAGSGNEGFIFFSLGSTLNPSILPERYRKILVKVFGSLKQRILWKWSEESMPDLPQNVMLRKWLPQRDLLGHPKIRLFITHGGLLSTQESNYDGVPVIGMPVYGDQHSNMMEAEKEGWARVMNWKQLEENTFRKLILDTINDHNLQAIVKRRSAIIRDRPIPPDQEAAFWVEYVLRHNGAPHILSPFRNLTWFHIYNIDVWTFIVCLILFIIWIIWKVFKLLLSLIFGSKKSKRKRE